MDKKTVRKINPGFTLVELIIVVVIVGILASLGIAQYNKVVEKSRTAEAKIHIGLMRKLTYQYYQENGSLSNMSNSDAGADNACTNTHFYRYFISGITPTWLYLVAERCISGGKTPNASAIYFYYATYNADTDEFIWYCVNNNDSSACYGLPAGDIMG